MSSQEQDNLKSMRDRFLKAGEAIKNNGSTSVPPPNKKNSATSNANKSNLIYSNDRKEKTPIFYNIKKYFKNIIDKVLFLIKLIFIIYIIIYAGIFIIDMLK